MNIKEGYINFLNHKTYYRICGPTDSKKTPLLFLHGGPGSTHNSFEVLDDIAEKDNRMLIMYDQIGCGKSYIEGHPEYFNKETWAAELVELRKQLHLDKVHILGQSWGGMLALTYALDYNPTGVKSYILSSTLPSSKLWEKEQQRRICYMDEKYQVAIKKALNTNTYTDPVYLEAVDVFMKKHCYPHYHNDRPEVLKKPKIVGTESYNVGWGPNEFTPIGNLKDFNVIDRLHEIKTPCLILNGQRDLSSPFINKTMYDLIPNAEWELFEYSGHMPYIEEHEKYEDILIKFLNKYD